MKQTMTVDGKSQMCAIYNGLEKIYTKFWRANEGGEVEQRGAASNRAKGGIEHVREDGRSQLPRTTFGRWRWMGHTELDGRWTF